MDRRTFIKSAAAAIAATQMPGAATAVEGWQPAVWEPIRTFTLTYRVVFEPVFRPTYRVGDEATFKLKANDRDRRKFQCAALEEVEGRVFGIVPAGAMPWRYLPMIKGLPGKNARGKPARLLSIVRKSKVWRRRYPGPMYLVGARGKGFALVPHYRMRGMGGCQTKFTERDWHERTK